MKWAPYQIEIRSLGLEDAREEQTHLAHLGRLMETLLQ